MNEETEIKSIDFLIHCAWENADEYFPHNHRLRAKLAEAEKEIEELRDKAWKYDELSK